MPSLSCESPMRDARADVRVAESRSFVVRQCEDAFRASAQVVERAGASLRDIDMGGNGHSSSG